MAQQSKKPPKQRSFPVALADLMKERGVAVPRGLRTARPEAYGNLDERAAEGFADLGDQALVELAERIAGHARRQAKRAKDLWEASPLIAELRRRGLDEPPPPKRVVGAAPVGSAPIGQWTDAEIVRVATEWSQRGRA